LYHPVSTVSELFGLDGRVAVVTGASGVLGGAIARGLAAAGAQVALLARRRDRLEALAAELGGIALAADVLDRGRLEEARGRLDRVDLLVNAAGGNQAAATGAFFELPPAAFDEVLQLNFTGTVLPCQVFGAAMEEGGAIVNVSSLAAHRALTRVAGYGAAKAAVENLTRWLAVELAPRGVRVNAIAPGFFVGEQNRALLLDESGRLTERGERIVSLTPAGRFGEPHEVAGTVVWLCSAAAAFVTGVVVPVDGGFDAFSGV
jgi:NAD(P)-dependent dehydrogenase (short-subunit alcohol dehydrogenase family)